MLLQKRESLFKLQIRYKISAVTHVLVMVLQQDVIEWSILITSLRDSAGACSPEAKSIERWTSWMSVKFNHEWKYWYLTCPRLAVICPWPNFLKRFSPSKLKNKTAVQETFIFSFIIFYVFIFLPQIVQVRATIVLNILNLSLFFWSSCKIWTRLIIFVHFNVHTFPKCYVRRFLFKCN